MVNNEKKETFVTNDNDDYKDNCILDEGIASISESLTNNTALTELDLNSDDIQTDKDAV